MPLGAEGEFQKILHCAFAGTVARSATFRVKTSFCEPSAKNGSATEIDCTSSAALAGAPTWSPVASVTTRSPGGEHMLPSRCAATSVQPQEVPRPYVAFTW